MLAQVPQQFSFAYFRTSLLHNWKRAAAYAALFIVPAIALSALVVAAVRFHFFSWPIGQLQLIVFLMGGIVNVYLLHHESRFFKPSFLIEGVWYTILLAISMCGLLVLFYSITKTPMESMAIADCCVFLLPCIAVQVLFAWRSMPIREFKVWYNPDDPALHLIAASNTRQAVWLKLVTHPHTAGVKAIPLSVPAKMKLGRVFHHYIAAQDAGNNVLQISRHTDPRSIGWVFYEEITGGLLRRHLDPYLSLQENKVKENATIVIVQVNMAAPAPVSIPIKLAGNILPEPA